jgi:hypothetical protein
MIVSVRLHHASTKEDRYTVKGWTIRTLATILTASALLALPTTASASNTNSGTNSAIVAGDNNTVATGQQDDIIGAGDSNHINGSGAYSTIVAGQSNQIGAGPGANANDFIGGGANNTIGIFGVDNSSGDVVLGGDQNTSAGIDTIAGGDGSAVLADRSVGLGTEADVPEADSGSVVLADGEPGTAYDPCMASTTNELTLCFTSVRIVLARDSNGNPTDFCIISAGSVTGTNCPLAQNPTVVVDALRTRQRELQLQKKVNTLEKQVKKVNVLQREVQLLLKRTASQ